LQIHNKKSVVFTQKPALLTKNGPHVTSFPAQIGWGLTTVCL
jgi:hypothetical protein